jgi:hypothetical protein
MVHKMGGSGVALGQRLQKLIFVTGNDTQGLGMSGPSRARTLSPM